MPETPPSLGRIVLFQDNVQKVLAPAIVTAVDLDNPLRGPISLTVFPAGGVPYPIDQVYHHEAPGGSGIGTGGRFWIWPPRV